MDKKSWRPEVFVDGEWCGNGLRFATKAEALASAQELLTRWLLPTDARAAASADPVNYHMPDTDQPRTIFELKGAPSGNA